jgi:hypothetical protein
MERMLSDDLTGFLRYLNEEKVEYLLIGGWAVGYVLRRTPSWESFRGMCSWQEWHSVKGVDRGI